MENTMLYKSAVGLSKMHLNDICHMLNQTYWGPDYSVATIEKFMDHSINFGIFDFKTDRQIAYARVITDYATLYYVSDVVVDAEFRRQGIGTLLMKTIVQYPELQDLRGMLITRNAQNLYRKVGFENYEATFMHKIQK